MQNIVLEAEQREQVSNGQLALMRKSGWIPAILYGGQAKTAPKKSGKADNVLLKIPEKTFLKTVGTQRHNSIVEIKWGGQTANAVVKEVQRDFVTSKLLHIDFQRILMTEKLIVMVPVHLAGEAPGVKLSGGILEHITRELKIEALPKDIPQAVNVDISQLEIGKGLSVKDIPAVPGVQVLSDPNLLVVNIVAPTVLEEAPAAAAAPGVAEPEVIAKGKKPEEGEAAAAPVGGKAPEKGAAPAGKEKGSPSK